MDRGWLIMLTCLTYNDMWNDLVSEPQNRIVECYPGLIPMGQLHFILCSTCVIFCINHLKNHNIWVFILCFNITKFILFYLFSFDKTMRKKWIYNSFCISVKFKSAHWCIVGLVCTKLASKLYFLKKVGHHTKIFKILQKIKYFPLIQIISCLTCFFVFHVSIATIITLFTSLFSTW